jgi:hypothetical protein
MPMLANTVANHECTPIDTNRWAQFTGSDGMRFICEICVPSRSVAKAGVNGSDSAHPGVCG